MPKPPERTFRPDDAEDAFAPYLKAVGEVVNAWNKLQDQLLKIFLSITGMPQDMAAAVWHAPRSDSVQRDMLRAALRATPDDKWSGRLATARDDIFSLLNRADKLSEERNDAVHAPVSLAIDGDKLVPFPMYFFGHPKAIRLKGKDIVPEFKRCKDAAITLREYAEKIETGLNFSTYPWPDKPALLAPQQAKNQTNPSRQARKEARRHPPPPSRG